LLRCRSSRAASRPFATAVARLREWGRFLFPNSLDGGSGYIACKLAAKCHIQALQSTSHIARAACQTQPPSLRHISGMALTPFFGGMGGMDPFAALDQAMDRWAAPASPGVCWESKHLPSCSLPSALPCMLSFRMQLAVGAHAWTRAKSRVHESFSWHSACSARLYSRPACTPLSLEPMAMRIASLCAHKRMQGIQPCFGRSALRPDGGSPFVGQRGRRWQLPDGCH
jgi:hypothetical protein